MLENVIGLVPTPVPLGLDPGATAAGEALAQQLATSEWLGPLAPVALSPFFGLTALSGIATYGPDWLQQRSGLFNQTSLLNSPALFWTMLCLSILTSLPRLSKVSKPLALAAENLEAYSAIIILIAVRVLSGAASPAVESELVVTSDVMSQGALAAGITGISIDLLMSAVAALNILVINGVKLFCEFIVWLVPFPTIDAIVEIANKGLCAGLMGLYCFSPTLAAAVNLLALISCALTFGWSYRRLRYYRHVITGPILAWLAPSWFAQRAGTFCGFCEESTAGLPKYSMVTITVCSLDSYRACGRWWWKRLELDLRGGPAASETGVIADRVKLSDAAGKQYVFLHRHWVAGDELSTSGSPAHVASIHTTQ